MDLMIAWIVNALMPQLLERLKYANWFPLMQERAPWLNAAFAAMVAWVSSVGISFAYDAEIGVLTVSGLIPDDIIRALVTALVGWAVQEISYRMTVKNDR